MHLKKHFRKRNKVNLFIIAIAGALPFRNILVHEKFNFIFMLFQYFNSKVIKGKILIFCNPVQ